MKIYLLLPLVMALGLQTSTANGEQDQIFENENAAMDQNSRTTEEQDQITEKENAEIEAPSPFENEGKRMTGSATEKEYFKETENMIWSPEICPIDGPNYGMTNTLIGCTEMCLSRENCTAFHFYHIRTETECIFRQCPLPTPDPTIKKNRVTGYSLTTDGIYHKTSKGFYQTAKKQFYTYCNLTEVCSRFSNQSAAGYCGYCLHLSNFVKSIDLLNGNYQSLESVSSLNETVKTLTKTVKALSESVKTQTKTVKVLSESVKTLTNTVKGLSFQVQSCGTHSAAKNKNKQLERCSLTTKKRNYVCDCNCSTRPCRRHCP